MRVLLAALFIAASAPIATASAQEVTKVGSFTIVQALDPIDDSNRSYVMAREEGEESEAGLAWRCMADGMNVVLMIGKYFGGDDDDEIQVITRIDQDEHSGMVYWPLLQGNRSAFMPMTRITDFTERAKSAKQIAVRATDPLDGETLTFIFPASGLTQALAKIAPCD